MLIVFRIYIFLITSISLHAMGHFIEQDLLSSYFDSKSLPKANQLILLRDSDAHVKLQSEIRTLKESNKQNEQYSFNLLSAEIYAYLAKSSDELAEAEKFEAKFESVLSKLSAVKSHLTPSQIKWLEYLEINGYPITSADDPRIANIIPFE